MIFMVLFVKRSPNKSRKKLTGRDAEKFAKNAKKNGYLLLNESGKIVSPSKVNEHDKIKLRAPLAGG